MIIVSQDKIMIYNYDNIEVIGVGNPLENNDGKFPIFIETISDNQYPIAEYNTKERATEVLQEIINAYSDFSYYKNVQNNKKENIGQRIYETYGTLDIYEMPKE